MGMTIKALKIIGIGRNQVPLIFRNAIIPRARKRRI